MTKITLTYFGMPGEGPTIKEARADAARKVQAYLDAGPELHLIQHPATPEIFILWNEPDEGWVYRSIITDQVKRPGGAIRHSGCTCLGRIEKREAIRRALVHLAGLIAAPEAARTLLADASDWQSWRRHAAWQLAYHAAPASEDTDSKRHQWACHHDREFIDQIPA